MMTLSIEDGSYKTKYKIGDTLKIDYNNSKIDCVIIGIDADIDENEKTVPFTIMPKNIVYTANIYSSSSAFGGPYDNASRTIVNNFKNNIKQYLIDRIVPVIKYTCTGYTSNNTTVNNAKTTETFWPLSAREIDVTPIRYTNGGPSKETIGATYSNYFNSNTKRIMKYNNTAVRWYTRTTSRGKTFGNTIYSSVCVIQTNGTPSDPGQWPPSGSIYTVVCFCLR